MPQPSARPDPFSVGMAPTGALDGPPPTPMAEQAQTAPMGLSGLAPQAPPVGLPQEVMAGISTAAEDVMAKIEGIVATIATAHPDLSPDFDVVLFALQRALQKLAAAQGSPTATSPTAAGSGFPGGGLSQAGPPA